MRITSVKSWTRFKPAFCESSRQADALRRIEVLVLIATAPSGRLRDHTGRAEQLRRHRTVQLPRDGNGSLSAVLLVRCQAQTGEWSRAKLVLGRLPHEQQDTTTASLVAQVAAACFRTC